MEQDEQDAVDNPRGKVHDGGDGHRSSKWVPAQQGEGDAFDEGDEQVDDEQGEGTEDEDEQRRLHVITLEC